jgi:hypothetical protein
MGNSLALHHAGARSNWFLALRKSGSGRMAASSLAVLLVLGAVAMPFFFQDALLLVGERLPATHSFRLATVANTLLAMSTALYLASLWPAGERLRRIAAWFAGLGAALTIVDLYLGANVAGFSERALVSATSMYYELAELMVVEVVILLFVAERALRRPVAGAFLMPLAMVGVAVEIWLANHGDTGRGFAAFGGLSGYWGQAYVLAQAIGFGAFLAASLYGILYAARYAAEESDTIDDTPLRHLPGLWRLYAMMVDAIACGVPLLLVAALMLGAWILDRGAWDWISLSRGGWTFGVAALYAGLAYVLLKRAPQGRRLATWAVAGFGASLCGFVLIHLADFAVQHGAAIAQGSWFCARGWA